MASPSNTDPVNADATQTLFLISDKIDRITARAKRLMKKTAHAEYPRSKTRHAIGNVRIVSALTDGNRARANFHVHRTKEHNQTVYMGEVRHTVVKEIGGRKIKHKRCILDLNSTTRAVSQSSSEGWVLAAPF